MNEAQSSIPKLQQLLCEAEAEIGRLKSLPERPPALAEVQKRKEALESALLWARSRGQTAGRARFLVRASLGKLPFILVVAVAGGYDDYPSLGAALASVDFWWDVLVFVLLAFPFAVLFIGSFAWLDAERAHAELLAASEEPRGV